MQKASIISLLYLAAFLDGIYAFTLKDSRIFAPWFNRPYKGPECVVEVVGVDLNVRPNRHYDKFSKPDIAVEVSHAEKKAKTQIEGNTYTPRFLWSTKLPYKSDRGFIFTVLECNVVEADEVMGRAFIPAEQAIRMMEDKSSCIMSIGQNIGCIKVKVYNTPTELKDPEDMTIVPLDESSKPGLDA